MSNEISQVIVTTTNHVDGFRIRKYIDVESVEIAYRRDVKSFDLEESFREGKSIAIERLRIRAKEMGGNAVVGMAINYAMNGEMLMAYGGGEVRQYATAVMVYGTVVEIEPVDKD